MSTSLAPETFTETNVFGLTSFIQSTCFLWSSMEYTEWKAGHTDHALIPGIETLPELEVRVRELLTHIATKYAGKRVLAVSHGAFIRKVVRVTSDKQLPLEGQRFGNASLSTFKQEGESWRILNFNPETLV